MHKYPTVRLNNLTLVYNLKGIIFRINIIKASILLFKVSLNTIYSYTQQAQPPKQILFYLFRDFLYIYLLSILSILSIRPRPPPTATDRYRPLPTATDRYTKQKHEIKIKTSAPPQKPPDSVLRHFKAF